jgi:glutamate-ammonia-ligase adenylyltransferase
VRPPVRSTDSRWLPEHWPEPADAAAALRLRESFAAIGPAQARLVQRPAVRAMLDCLGGNSPYLAGLALHEAPALRDLLRHGPDATVSRAFARLAAMPPDTPRPRLAAALREAKRVVALTAAIADIGGVWSLAQVTAALSDLAEAALRLAVAHLLGESGLAGFCVLGMGKLGARELNYSSDIDLVLLFDPAANPHRGATLGQDFVRLARALVGLLQDRTGDGYVFRTDLRLRPDPAATPLAVALPAALAYYESMGQSWERAAMLKARPVAGDLALGAQFLAAIRPFIWRRHLDFAALADIHAMKRRIDAHGPAGADPLLGRDLKRGPGGIREIEFLAQALQLVWGGRDPGLRAPQTLEALAALAAHSACQLGDLSRDVGDRPVPKAARSRRVGVVHRDREASRCFGITDPGQLRREVLAAGTHETTHLVVRKTRTVSDVLARHLQCGQLRQPVVRVVAHDSLLWQ